MSKLCQSKFLTPSGYFSCKEEHDICSSKFCPYCYLVKNNAATAYDFADKSIIHMCGFPRYGEVKQDFTVTTLSWPTFYWSAFLLFYHHEFKMTNQTAKLPSLAGHCTRRTVRSKLTWMRFLSSWAGHCRQQAQLQTVR